MRLLRPLFLVPAGLLAAVGAGAWLARRWGYRVAETTRDLTGTPGEVPMRTPERGPDVQTMADGTGPRFHRRYRVDIAGTAWTPERLMARVAADPDDFCAAELARFEKTAGEEGALAEGDEFMVHINGPWNGPVRVASVEPHAFTLVTREGHMEAGSITFSAMPSPAVPDALRFTIESWARSRDAVVDLAYDDLELAKEAQQAMWTFFCERAVEVCGGEAAGPVEVLTERDDHGD